MTSDLQPRRGNRFWQRGERAQTTTEFVVVFPMLLLLFFLMLEFGWMFKNYIVITNSAREAARCAIANNCKLNNAQVTPDQLLVSRMNAGIIGNLKNLQTDVHYIDSNNDDKASAGDTLVVCAKAGNAYITPLLVFASMAGVLPPLSEGLPIVSREQMIIEFIDPNFPDDGNAATPTFWSGLSEGGDTCS